MTLARRLLMTAIRGYKHRVSPRKGFDCAYRVHLGACSCSTLGLRAVSRYGAWRGLGVLSLRLQQCRLVAGEFRARPFIARAGQAGFADCDVPCDDAFSCGDTASSDGACEVFSCLGCADDGDGWPWSTRTTAEPARRRRRRGDPAVRQPGAGAPPEEPPPAP